MVIRAKKLSFRYPLQEKPALTALDLDLGPGAYLISGATGSGKSTLGLILAGAIPHLIRGELTGTVEVAGVHPPHVPVRQLARRVGLLLQNVESQIFTDRVADEVAFGLENLAIPPREISHRIAEALARVGAAGLKDRRLATLSAGERQRVMLAALLTLGQEVLILDEPLAYLDRTATQALLAVIASLTARGTTCLLLEHRRELVRPVIHGEVCLHHGSRVSRFPGAPLPSPLPAEVPAGEVVLSLNRVSFGWQQGRPLFRELTLAVQAGRSLVLLGDNGAGKTTLLKLAAGLVPVQAGGMQFLGRPWGRRRPGPLPRELAFVLQNPHHQLRLPTVWEEVAWGAVNKEVAAAEMAALGLAGLEGRHPHALSSGQKRRLTLAAALARRPQVLLLDEPTVGQDDGSLALVLARLKDFVAQGGALVTATHDLRAARVLAQSVLLLDRGRALTGGPELVPAFFEPRPADTENSGNLLSLQAQT